MIEKHETHEGTYFEMMKILGESADRAIAAHYEEFPDIEVRPALEVREVDGFAEFYLVLEPCNSYKIEEEV